MTSYERQREAVKIDTETKVIETIHEKIKVTEETIEHLQKESKKAYDYYQDIEQQLQYQRAIQSHWLDIKVAWAESKEKQEESND